MNTLFTRTLVLALVIAGGFAATGAARGETAMDQLVRANNGRQHQGETFDGSAHNSPRGGLDVPVRR